MFKLLQLLNAATVDDATQTSTTAEAEKTCAVAKRDITFLAQITAIETFAESVASSIDASSSETSFC